MTERSASNVPSTVAGTLDSFIQIPRPQSRPIATSQEIRDHGSTFVANVYHALTLEEAKARIQHVKHVLHGSKPASHEIAAWRVMALKHGRTGLGGPDDFELTTGFVDDGEQWAGSKVLKAMQNQAVIDAVVIVSRWYGGTLLGPARFTHVETCASEVCREFKRIVEIQDCISILSTLDALLDDTRSELAKISAKTADNLPGSSSASSSQGGSERAPKKPDYSTLDLPKARRLIKARENAIESVKALLAKRRN